jgi:hypothetical protein
LREPSTYIGLTKAFAAGGWHALDGNNRGELLMQAAIFTIGMLEALLPAGTLFKRGNKP